MTSEPPLPAQSSNPHGGLFDGFPGYRTATDAECQEALRNGLVACDANVLLNLYRYADQARADFLATLDALKPRLFVPHQAVSEFWRHREEVITTRPAPTLEATTKIQAAQQACIEAFGAWASRLGLSSAEREAALRTVTGSLSPALQYLENNPIHSTPIDHRRTTEDPVLARLEPLLQGCVGPAMAAGPHDEALKEAKRRIDNKIPPGFEDSKKEWPFAAGDYLVWRQILDETPKRSVSQLVIVTGETKKDWWRLERGELRGPRPELALEAATIARVQLILMRPETLLLHAQQAFGLTLSAATTLQVATASASDLRTPIAGWTPSNALFLIQRLRAEAPVQCAAIIAAFRNGGFVPREEVYRLGHYDSTRTLRGFTRPAQRVAQELQDEELLAEEAPQALLAEYDRNYDPVNAAGFRVPVELLSALSEIAPKELCPQVLDVTADLLPGPTGGDYSNFRVTSNLGLHIQRVSATAIAGRYRNPLERIVARFARQQLTEQPQPSGSILANILTSDAATRIDSELD